MLDGLLKSKYHTKCKSLLRMIKTRLEALKKKKCSVVKFLKNDIADLLRSGLDYNAYGRAQWLLADKKMIACYDFMEQFCDTLYNNVNAMAKQRECPEECKEAVQSLMYSAARISEIPELRDLRKVFTERYGNALEPYTNKQFVETFVPVSATKEMKLELLNEIAAEFNLDWNSKSFENELGAADEKKNAHTSSKNNGDEKKGHFSTKTNKGKFNRTEEGYNLSRNSSEGEMISSCRGDSSDLASSSSVGNSSDDEVQSKKPLSYKPIPPPYLKAAHKVESKPADSPKEIDSTEESKAKPRSVRRSRAAESNSNVERPLKPPPGRERFTDNDKAKEKSPTLSWKRNNEGFGLRKSKSDEMPERLIDGVEKAFNKHNRTVSEQPQAPLKHVHPNLPDGFEDLAAKHAALTGR